VSQEYGASLMDNHGIFDLQFSICFYDEISIGMEERTGGKRTGENNDSTMRMLNND
jgi:hypothetical protein